MATNFPGDDKYPKSRYADSSKDEGDGEHAFAERIDRWPDDDRLRANGWRIHSRPRTGEDLWEKEGRVVPFSKALLELPPVREMPDEDRPGSGKSKRDKTEGRY